MVLLRAMAHLARVATGCVALAAAGCTLLLQYGEPPTLDGSPGLVDAARGDDDAAPAVDAANVPFCQRFSPAPTLCASFDGPGYLAEWGNSSAAGGRLDRDETNVSPPASLRVTANPGVPVSASVGADFPAWTDRWFSVDFDFELQILEAAPAGALAVIATPLLFSGGDDPTYLLQLVARPLDDGSSVSLEVVEVSTARGESRGHPSSVTMQRGAWSRVQLRVTHAEAGDSVELDVGGQRGVSSSLPLAPRDGEVFTSFGFAAVDPETTAWSFLLDDVAITFR